jgi:1-acyl-sn-glycerol-3-phosphate acyltransferase
VSRSTTFSRRFRSVGIVTIGLVAATVLLPVILGVALLFDVLRFAGGRRHFVGLRLVVFGWVYLASELAGVVALGIVWLGTGGGRARSTLLGATYAIQRWWTWTLFRTIRSLFRMQFEVEGDEYLTPGPIHVFMRHASIVDNLLPGVFIARPHGYKLRYVLKRELLSDPALDIAGSRLPNYFVDRQVGGDAEVAAVGALGMDLAADEGVLIYPEGTRFTPERRERALGRLEGQPALLERARGLRAVLPPRPGGPLALLEADPPADVVIAAHSGLDGFSHISNILDGGLIGSTIRIRFTRFPIAEIPTAQEDRIDWLYDRWAEVDDWISAQ